MKQTKQPVPGMPVILANGLFPTAKLALSFLREAKKIICCDGAVEALSAIGGTPEVVIGDLDSISSELRSRYADRLVRIEEQETNDLTKSILWAREQGYSDLVILGADGKRLDHTLGNASLLVEHADKASLVMVTDHGMLYPVTEDVWFNCRPGQQVSIFSLTAGMQFTSTGLRYPLNALVLDSWWQGTLNETLGERFSIASSRGRALVYIND